MSLAGIRGGFRVYLAPAAALVALVTAACTSSPGSTNNPSAKPAAVPVSQSGIVTARDDPNFSLVTSSGRLVLKWNSRTLVATVDEDTKNPTTRPVNESDLYPGQKIMVDYNPASNLVTKIAVVDYKAKLYFPLTGAIKSIFADSMTLTADYMGTVRDIFIRFTPAVLIVKSNGSIGNALDLSSGMNVRTFCNPGTNGAIVIEIQ